MRIVHISHDEVTPLFCMDTTGQQKLTETWRQESPNKGRVRMVTEEPGRREGRRCCSPICRWGGSPVLSHREQKAGKQGEKGRSRETTESCSSEKPPNIWEDRQAHEQNYLVEARLHSSFLRGNKLNPAWFKCPILSARHSRKDNIQKTVISLLWYRLFFFLAGSVRILNFTDLVHQTVTLHTAELHTALYQLPSSLGQSLATCLLQLHWLPQRFHQLLIMNFSVLNVFQRKQKPKLHVYYSSSVF